MWILITVLLTSHLYFSFCLLPSTKEETDCCDQVSNRECMETCRRVLRSTKSETEILDALESKCGPVKPHSPMWSCLLKLVPSKLNKLPLDGGKLSCCAKASTTHCENLCRRTYYTDWQLSWTQFENECLLSKEENELKICIEDAENTCKYGCTGLSFCSHFNNNIYTPFRSCSVEADEAAKREYNSWINNEAVQNFKVFLKTSLLCSKKKLQILACILHLRPCELSTHETSLCYSDCLEIMTTCVDWSTVTEFESSESLCSKFLPATTNSCISMKYFMKDVVNFNQTMFPSTEIYQPCKNNTCASNQLCLSAWNISTFSCQPACNLGEMSKQLVAVGSWIQIPRFERQGCYKICQCTLNGVEKCKILNCFSFKSCWVQDRFISHNTEFFLECNRCRCFMGELTCFRNNCGENRSPTLPCDCPTHYVPTCSRLGITYASSCLAKCAGFIGDEIEFGSCSSKNHCISNPCNDNEICIAKSRVCLSSIYKPCRQYECISSNCTATASNETWEPVCDKNNNEHKSLCSMIKAGKTLGYRGPCLKNCKLYESVCGVNGETYPNECAAVSDKTVVDYSGPCITVGLINDKVKPRCTDVVSCPELVNSHCVGVTPPGACCPICGGAARIYYSRKQLDRILYMMDNEKDKDAVTLQALLNSLERHISIQMCSLRGMVTIDGDIVIVIVPVSKTPSAVELRACVLETERLVILIQHKSPSIIIEVPLSAITGAEVIHRQVSNVSCIIEFNTFILILLVFQLIKGIIN
ncbi:reversion-inducing cysteine-rich protein with Kazal motifs [Leptopilina heterotoma]|uniref:reversion-inducing cysteine-rich protein with Kazal motifs n=1 Tax=Leptopilina heterotoma TaxID=63436 RepID=UPI001CA877C5|nr:reversion-inducing cysteine-rich protein with Kazal motifs [Leptopilina heterotoma]